ncbi:MAG: LexA family transcriptional regulator [Muribaculaceae bacterium]|nr:LexA family transcriptional regulator [Muribaculaceae bacterium]
MNDDIIGRIKEIFEKTGLSQNDIASRIGTSQSAISAMLNGSRKISVGTLAKISDAFNVDLDWLKTGEVRGEEEETSPQVSYTEGAPYYDVDFLLGFDEIGSPDRENPDYLIRMPGYEKVTLWCNASGHSMEPEISNGDIVALQRIEDFSFLPYGDVYGIITTNGMRTIKRLGRGSREGYYNLIPTNKDYDEQEIPIRMIAMVYRVMGAMKPF